MEIPKFLIADNSDYPDKIFILHTEYPRFIMDVEIGDLEWFDDLEEDSEADLENEITSLIERAYEFFDREMDSYEE